MVEGGSSATTDGLRVWDLSTSPVGADPEVEEGTAGALTELSELAKGLLLPA